MKKCIGCVLKICAILLGIAAVTLIIMSYLGIDLFDNDEDEKSDIIDIKPLNQRITKIKRNYTELEPTN